MEKIIAINYSKNDVLLKMMRDRITLVKIDEVYQVEGDIKTIYDDLVLRRLSDKKMVQLKNEVEKSDMFNILLMEYERQLTSTFIKTEKLKGEKFKQDTYWITDGALIYDGTSHREQSRRYGNTIETWLEGYCYTRNLFKDKSESEVDYKRFWEIDKIEAQKLIAEHKVGSSELLSAVIKRVQENIFRIDKHSSWKLSEMVHLNEAEISQNIERHNHNLSVKDLEEEKSFIETEIKSILEREQQILENPDGFFEELGMIITKKHEHLHRLKQIIIEPQKEIIIPHLQIKETVGHPSYIRVMI